MKNTNIEQHSQSLLQLLKRLSHLKLNAQPIPGLTKSEHEFLVVLRFNTNDEKSMLTASEIAGLLQITPAGGTHLFKPLERAGYITRKPDTKDRRVTLIGLTEKGIEATDALLADINKQVGDLINYLGQEDSQNFIRLLAKVFDFITPGLAVVENENGNAR